MITRRDSLKLGIAGIVGLGNSPALPSLQAGPVRANNEQFWRTGWPMFTGPNGNFSVSPSGTALIEDLRQARQLWQSQENDIGDAKKLSQAVAWNNDTMPPGGVASLIVADGMAFAAYFKPRGNVFDTSIEAAVRKRGQEFHREQYLVAADDFFLAIDANTGRTRWKVVEADKGMNFAAAKRGGWGVTPVYHQGTVFSVGTTGRLYAYEATTGKRRWETNLGRTHELAEAEKKQALTAQRLTRFPGWLSSLTVAEGVLIVPLFDAGEQSLRGVNVENGRTLWETPRVLSRLDTPSQFRSGGRTYVLANTSNGELRAIDPRSGKVLWTLNGLGPTLGTLSPSDTHVVLNARPDRGNRTPGLYGAYRITPERAERAWMLPDQPQFGHEWHLDGGAIHKIVIRDGLAYITARIVGRSSRLLIIRERTGEVVVDQELGNGWGWLPMLAEDRLIIADDLSHTATAGGYHFTMYTASTDRFRRLGEAWRPSHRPTNGYEVPMVDPLVAGRWFMRGRDGRIRCYDARRPG